MLGPLRTDDSAPLWRPIFFRLLNDVDRDAMFRLVEQHGSRITVCDTLDRQLRDLIRLRHPSRKLEERDVAALLDDHLGGLDLQAYGVWVYYPWSRRLVHLLDETEFAEVRTNRNCYLITPDEQAALAAKRIGIVGLSVGKAIAVTLALERAFGQLRIADFDSIDLSNLNRVATSVHNLGLPKTIVAAREIAEVDPFLQVSVFADGITADNVDPFLCEGGKLDVVIEECDSIDVKVLVRTRARAAGIPVVMQTSARGMLDIERFDLEPERALFHGLAGDLDMADLRGLTTEQKVPYVLRILDAQNLTARMKASMLEIESSVSTWPQLGSAVACGGAVAADVVRRMMLDQLRLSGRFHVDPEDIGRSAQAEPMEHRHQVPAPRQDRADQIWTSLVQDAILAPSGGNQQPWHWSVSDSGVLNLYLDRQRTSGLIDFDSGGSYLALGCATENLVLAAHANGSEIQMRTFPSAGNDTHAASFRLAPKRAKYTEPHWNDRLQLEVKRRQTQRNLSNERPIGPTDMQRLSAAVQSIPGAQVQWHTDPHTLRELGRLVGAADRLRILHPVCHREMFREIRWSAAEAQEQRDGIDIETLGLTPSDRAGIELCRDWAALQLVARLEGGHNLEKMSARQICNAAAVGLITMPRSRAIDYFAAGRAVQRMWLTATELGIGVHPMTALVYFFARVLRGGGCGFDPKTHGELRRLRSQVFEALFQTSNGGTEVLLFRIGHFDGGGKRSLRRPVSEVLRFE